MPHTQNTVSMEIGDPLLLTCNGSNKRPVEQIGYLQYRKKGALCIDVDPAFRPAKGTPIQVSKLHAPAGTNPFSSEILGHSCLHGHLPVLLIKAPKESTHPAHGSAHRIPAGMRAEISWDSSGSSLSAKTGLVTDLGGEGARFFTRALPDADRLFLSLSLPDDFVEASSARRSERLRRPARQGLRWAETQQSVRDALQDDFTRIECRLAGSSSFHRDAQDIIHSLTLVFAQPHEGCFRLVRHLERQALQRGLSAPHAQVAA